MSDTRDGVDVAGRNGMTEQQEERLLGAVRAWVQASDDLTRAAQSDDVGAVVDLADRATLARLAFHQTLVDLGWTPPDTRPEPG